MVSVAGGATRPNSRNESSIAGHDNKMRLAKKASMMPLTDSRMIYASNISLAVLVKSSREASEAPHTEIANEIARKP